MMIASLGSALAQQTLSHHLPSEVASRQAALVGPLPSEQELNFSIVLPLRNQSNLTDLLRRLYDPASPDYRHFLSVAQFTDQFGPTVADYQAVVSFAQAHGFVVTGTPDNRMVVPVRASVDQAEKAFHINMNLYHHPTEDRTFFSPDREPSLDLAVPVAHISGLNNFSIPQPMVKRSQAAAQAAATVLGSGPSGSYLGSDMRAAYYGGTTLDGTGQSIGIVEFGGYDIADVNDTFSNAGQTYTVPINNVLLSGSTGAVDDGYDAEQVLDIVQAIGMAPGLSQVRVYIGAGGDDAVILNSMASENIAKSLSCSWSWSPDDPSVDDPFFLEFAAQGQTFLTASGDYGAYDYGISPYFYPAEDANVTAVGATHLTTKSAGGAWSSEAAWNSGGYGTGGGPSFDGIAIPSWQAGLATTLNGGSTTLRNVPDVAMEGDSDNFACALGQCYTYLSGTSFATPRWAGFIALVNQQAVETGKAPTGGIGFINPAIYAIGKGTSYGSEFHDVTAGNNQTAGQPVFFNAEKGYDLTTGWGSASGQNLIDALAGKQIPGFWIRTSSPTVSLVRSGTATTTIEIVDAGGFTGSVTLALGSTLPSGVTAKWSINPTTGSSVLTFTASASALASTTTVNLTGTSGKLTTSAAITLAVHAPTFSLTSAIASLQVAPGASVTSTITLTPEYGFTGSATLSVSGLPSGVTATIAPNPTATTAVLTLKASATAVGGSSLITLTGTSGSVVVSTKIPLLVAAPTFTLSAPSSLNIGQGTTSFSYIGIIQQYGFTGNVSLSLAGLPSGVTATISPNPTSSQSQLTLTASSTAALGNHVLTLTGTSGSLKVTTSFTLGIFVPIFQLSSPSQINLGLGTSAGTYVNVLPEYGFTGNVTLAASGLPAGVTASFSPNPTPGGSILTLTAASTAALKSSTVTITGTSGTLTATATFSLAVLTPTFAIPTLGSITLGQGTTNSFGFGITPEYGFTGNVTLSVAGLPSGVTVSFSPNPTPGFATMTLVASAAAPLGTYPLTITGISGSQKVSVSASLGIFAPTFNLSPTGNVILGQGSTAQTYVYTNPQYGFTGSVTLAASGLPSGVTASFTPNPTTGTASVTLVASKTAAIGNQTVTITGTSGKLTSSTSFVLTTVAPTFTLSSYGSLTVGQGSSSTTSVSVNALNGFTGSVNLGVSGLPNGATATFSLNPTDTGANLTVTALAGTPVGNTNLIVTGIYGTEKSSVTIPVSVVAPSFSFNTGGSVTLQPGNTVTSGIYLSALNGFSGRVSFSVTGLPSGVTASFSPNPATDETTLTLTASSAAVAGLSTLTIVGTSGNLRVSVPLALTVAIPSFSLGYSGGVTMGQGSTTSTYLYLSTDPGFLGSVKFTASGLPTGVSGVFSPNPTTYGTTFTLTAASTAVATSSTFTITGTSGTRSVSVSVPLQIFAPTFTLDGLYDLTIPIGTTQNTWVYVDPQYGFNGSVKLAISGLPAGVTAVISPNPTTGQAGVVFTASTAAKPSTQTVTVTGTSGTKVVTSTFSLTVAQPAFSVYDGSTLALSQGGSSSSYVYVNGSNGFTGNVNLTISGLPTGVTAAFSGNPVATNGYVILTLTATTGAAIGTQPIKITGTSGTETFSLGTSLSVYAPSFGLSTNGATVGQGSTTTSWIYIQSNYAFSGSVKLAVSGLPAGVTGTFSPNPSATGSSTLTLTAAGNASLGQYNANITGTYGNQTASAVLPITVMTPTFTLGGGGSVNLGRGTSATTNLFINPQNGFKGSVQLSASGLPSGVTATFSPNPSVANQGVTMTLTASSAAPLGQYNATINAISGSQTVSTPINVAIYTPGFTISTAGSTGIGQGQTASSYILVNPQYGFTGSVKLAVSGLPSGVTGSFTPNPSTGYATLTLTGSASITPGEYYITVTGTSGTITASTRFSLTVYAPDFSLYSQGVTVGQGTSASTYITINALYGLTGAVKFTTPVLPSGVTASFSPNPATGSTTMTLTASSTAALGEYNMVVTGTYGSTTHSITVPVSIYTPVFTTSGPGNITIGQGTTTSSYLYAYSQYGFNGKVTYTVSGLPSGVTGTLSPNPATVTPSSTVPSILTLTASPGAAVGQYNIAIRAASGSQAITTVVPLSILTPSFSVSMSMGQIVQGTTGTGFAQIASPYGFTGAVALSISGLPSGVTASFSPNPATANEYATTTIKVASTVPPGQYNLTLIGKFGTLVETYPFVLSIAQAEPAVSLSATWLGVMFPPTATGSTSPAQVVTLTNTGYAPLTISSIAYTGTNASEFAIAAKTCSTSLAVNASCTLSLVFKPTIAGAASAQLIFTDNAPNSPQGVVVSAPGASASLVPSSDSDTGVIQ